MTEPLRDLRIGSLVVRRQPPIVGDYCITPTGRRAWTPCAYESALCQGETAVCDRCHFPYCAQHFSHHKRSFMGPPDTVLRFMGWLQRALEEIRKTDGKKRPRHNPREVRPE